MDKTTKAHSFLYEENKLTISGVEKVLSSNDKTISVKLGGKTLTINGECFSLGKVDLTDGTLSATGEIKDMKYGAGVEKQALLKRLFK